MDNAGYTKAYMTRVEREINNILHLAEFGTVSCYDDVYQKHKQSGVYAPITLSKKRNIIRAIERFDLFGRYPDATNRHALHLKNSRYQLCAEYRTIIDSFIESEAARGNKKESSIHVQSTNASMFLLALQNIGVYRLADATHDSVFEAFTNLDGSTRWHYSCKHNIGAVFKSCASKYPDCAKILALLPAFKRWRKNIQYLTPEEIAKVKEVLLSASSHLSLRDKAIGTLALYTGLRGCDIANLTMDALDWENDLIHIKQQKTGVPLTLPITAIVGNAIHDYIETERPQTECEHLFIAQVRPFGCLQGSPTMNSIARKVMKAAGIRQNPNDRQGFHIFRHHLATKLLGNGVPRPVVSNIVGHTNPKSLDPYLRADFLHLKNCAISIEEFPVAQEVFEV